MSKKKRGAPYQGTAVIWQAGLRERWGISEATLWRWMRAGKLPSPDVHIAGRRGWRPETIASAEIARVGTPGSQANHAPGLNGAQGIGKTPCRVSAGGIAAA